MNKFLSRTLLLVVLCTAGCSAPSVTNDSEANNTRTTLFTTQTLQTDFTNNAEKIGVVYDFFDVSVRTERGNPQAKPATFGRRAKVNTVRILGGWANQDLNGDTYQWDGKKYVYHFEKATQQIDAWLKNDWDIFQIVLDNPPWAFQRGYAFVDEIDGKHYLKKDRVGVYGNGLPPNDAQAWQNYIQALMQHLVKTYGKEQVLSWRFRVGSEIDTRPQHWAATMQQFFDHYQNTVMAIKSVLPDAKVGTHFREATHISNYIDYTGKKEDAYAPHFVAWAKANNVPYDFLAISYYPHITHAHEIDMDTVYKTQIAPILEHPDYNPNASFEIHEYKFIVEMLRAGFVSVETSHNSAFFAMFAKMLLEKNIKEVFQWGNTSSGSYSPEAMTQLALNDMVGNNLHRNQVVGDALFAGNVIDGIFTQRQDHSGFDILTFNFNKNNLAYQAEESIRLSMIVNKPRGTKFQYRMAQIDQTTNIDQLFFTEFPKAVLAESKGGWRKDDAHPTASAINALNETGVSIYHQHKNKYGKINTLKWGAWQKARTTSGNKVDISVIEIKNQLPSFAVQKYQIRW